MQSRWVTANSPTVTLNKFLSKWSRHFPHFSRTVIKIINICSLKRKAVLVFTFYIGKRGSFAKFAEWYYKLWIAIKFIMPIVIKDEGHPLWGIDKIRRPSKLIRRIRQRKPNKLMKTSSTTKNMVKFVATIFCHHNLHIFQITFYWN